MQSIIDFLGCGTLTDYPNTQDAVLLNITSFQDIRDKVLPIFQKGILLGGKSRDFIYWKQVYDLMFQGQHFTKDGVN